MHELTSQPQQRPATFQQSSEPKFPTLLQETSTEKPKLSNLSVQDNNKLSSHLFAALSIASPSGTNGLKPFSTQQAQSSMQSQIGTYQCPTPHCNGYNCSLIRGQDGCQKCVCDSPCAPCPPHCVKTKTTSEGRCPICDCTGAAAASPVVNSQCPTVDCPGSKCRKVKDSKGCYTCVCDPQCDVPKCDPGCQILMDVPPGQCPGCVCKITVVQAVVPKRKPCPPVSCSRINCREASGNDGCPKCFCDQLCPPPRCDPGCELQTDVAAGQCPTCVCPEFPDDNDDDDDDEHYCPNLFCADYGCREVPGPAGCPICHCDPLCRTPVCEPGCKIVSNKKLGRCPVCICSNPLNDSSNSTKSVERTTVSVVLEPVVAETTEPSVDTVTNMTLDDVTETPTATTEEPPTTTEAMTTTTCPPPVCAGLQCRKTKNPDGCLTCKCRFKCPDPKCQGNCYAETNSPPHRCPGCICPSSRRPPKPRSLVDLIF